MDEKKDVVGSAKPQWLEQMEGILETLNEGVLIADDSEYVLFVNTVYEEMTGIFRDDIICLAHPTRSHPFPVMRAKSEIPHEIAVGMAKHQGDDALMGQEVGILRQVAAGAMKGEAI